MAIKCVNISHPKFTELKKQTGFDSFALEMEIAEFQNKYGTDEFPSAEQIQRINSSVPVNEDLESTMRSVLSNIGFRVESLEWYEQATGNKMSGESLVDMSRKVVAIANDRTSDLPEEYGHIVIEQQEGTYALERAVKLVTKTDEYNQYAEEYRDKYTKLSKDKKEKRTAEDIERKVRKEVLGKLLGKHMIKSHTRQTDRTLLGHLKKLWNNFLDLFRNKPELEQFLDFLANKGLRGDVAFRQGEDTYFSLPGFEESEDFLKKSLDAIKSKNRTEKDKMVDPNLRKVKRVRAKKIQKNLEEGMFLEGILETIRFMKGDVKDAVEYVKMVKNGGSEVTGAALNQLRAFIAYYKPLVDELNTMLTYDVFPLGNQKLKDAIFKRLQVYSDAFAEVEQFDRYYNKLHTQKILRQQSAKEHGFDINDPDLDRKIQEKTGLDIRNEVNYIHRDSNIIQTWFGSLREVGDNILNLVYAAVKRLRTTIIGETVDWGQEFLRKARDLGFLNKDMSWAYEKNEEGKYTGNFIQEYLFEAHEEALNEFRKQKHEEYGFPEDYDERRVLKEQMKKDDDPVLRDYNRDMALWFATNTMPIPNVQERITEMERTLSAHEYVEWRYHNISEYRDASGQARMHFKGELVTPTDGRTRRWNNQPIKSVDWRNPQYEKLNDKQHEFLDYILEKKKEIDLSINVFSHGRAPQLTESTADIIYNRSSELFKRLGRQIKESYTRVEEDKDIFGLEETYRPDGSIQRYLPKRYISKLKETDSITPDVLSSMISYYHMASEYKNFARSVDDFEAIQTQLGRRTYKGTKKIKPGTETEYYKQMSKHLEMSVYGQHKKDIEINGYSIGKILGAITSWVRSTNLSWNLFTSTSGYFQASGRAVGEAYVGEHYSAKEYAKAYTDFNFNHLAQIVLETANPIRTNKLGVFMLHSNVWSHQDIFDNLDKDRLTRKHVESGMYWNYEVADLAVKGPVVLAVLRDMKIMDGNVYSSHQLKTMGKNPDDYPTVWDEATVQDGKLNVNIDHYQLQKVLGRIEYISNNLDGRLSNEDYAAAHQHAVANMLTTHRGWLIDGMQKRFKRENFNYMTGQKEVGYYRVVGSFLKKTFYSDQKKIQFKNMMTTWNELSDVEKKAMWRAMYEYVQVAMALVLAKVVNGIDDEEDTWETNSMAYLTNRIVVEMGSFAVFPPIGIAEFANTLQNPIMVAQKIELLIDIPDFFSSKEVESGPYKRLAKRQRAFLRLLPIVKNSYLLMDPKSTNQYMKNKTLRFMY